MTDPRWDRLAEVLVRYSTAVRRGDRVLITMVEPDTFPLTQAVHAEVVRAGGLPQVEFQSAAMERDLLELGDPTQIGWVPELQDHGMSWADVSIGLRGASSPSALDGIPAERIALHRRAMGVTSTARTERTRWVLVRVPNRRLARAAGLSAEQTRDLFFDAVLRNWEREARSYASIAELFAGGSRVAVQGPGTDLSFSVEGRTWEIDDGHINMPGGEIYTAPVEESVEGEIVFDFPGVYAGRSVPDVRLRFSRGQVVEAHAGGNEDLLHELLDMDEGSRRVGEFGVGLNAGIDRFWGDILYDEKIRGTVHIALGRSYAACGGRNRSALHWDIVKDLRSAGHVLVDGRVVLERGRFAVD